MKRVPVTIRLPKELAERVEAAGLLTDEQFEHLLRNELVRLEHLRRFADTVEQLRSLEPPLTQEEIDAEIEAHKREKRELNQDTQS